MRAWITPGSSCTTWSGQGWEVPRPGGAYHLGYWSDDVPASAGTGEPDGDAPAPIVMHRAPSGLYIELVDRSLRETLFGQDLAED
jgi:hypothetical protein